MDVELECLNVWKVFAPLGLALNGDNAVCFVMKRCLKIKSAKIVPVTFTPHFASHH